MQSKLLLGPLLGVCQIADPACQNNLQKLLALQTAVSERRVQLLQVALTPCCPVEEPPGVQCQLILEVMPTAAAGLLGSTIQLL